MKVGDLVKVTSKKSSTHQTDYGRIILLLEFCGMKSYNLSRDEGKLFTGMTGSGSSTKYYIFEHDAEVISENL